MVVRLIKLFAFFFDQNIGFTIEHPHHQSKATLEPNLMCNNNMDTVPKQITIFARRYMFQTINFGIHVKFPECNWSFVAPLYNLKRLGDMGNGLRIVGNITFVKGIE